ncbi:MAG: hypothetical protein V1909_04825 [Candidatus Micrarchaeota archaeon]
MKETHADHKDDVEFSAAISSLKKSEDGSKEQIEKAHEKANAHIKEAREKADVQIEGAREEAVALKDKLLLESKRGIESERVEIIGKAEKEASELEKRKLKQEDIRKLAIDVL